MKARLLRGIAAAAISLAVLLPGAAQPAQAQDVPAPTEVGAFTFTFLVSVGDKVTDGILTRAEIAVVVGEMIIGVRDSGARILAEIDADRVAGSMTALRDAMGYTSMMRESTRDANRFFGYAMHAAHNAHDKLTFGSPEAATLDALGRVSMAGYDLYMGARLNSDLVAGRVTANENLVPIVNEYLQMLNTLLGKLKPVCSESSDAFNYVYSCRAFDGTVETWWMNRAGLFSPWMIQRGEGAPWEEGSITLTDQEAIASIAMVNTIRPDAVEAMNNLNALKVRLLTP